MYEGAIEVGACSVTLLRPYWDLNIIPLPALLSCSLELISPVGLRNRPRIVSLRAVLLSPS